jgi:hypothetical protein
VLFFSFLLAVTLDQTILRRRQGKQLTGCNYVPTCREASRRNLDATYVESHIPQPQDGGGYRRPESLTTRVTVESLSKTVTGHML